MKKIKIEFLCVKEEKKVVVFTVPRVEVDDILASPAPPTLQKGKIEFVCVKEEKKVVVFTVPRVEIDDMLPLLAPPTLQKECPYVQFGQAVGIHELQ